MKEALATKITAADVDRYYDDYYKDYQRQGTADLSQNCHGYAYGVGDHIMPEGFNGVEILLDDADPNNKCYIKDVDPNEAEYAYGFDHTVLVTGGYINIGSGMTEPGIKSSSEKNIMSAVYTRTAPNGQGLSVTLAANRANLQWNPAYYKKN